MYGLLAGSETRHAWTQELWYVRQFLKTQLIPYDY